MKRKYLKLQHWLLATLMGTLGFTSCHCHKQLATEKTVDTVTVPDEPQRPTPPSQNIEQRDENRLMYGVPTMNYMIRGQVKNPKGKPVKDIRVNLLERGMQTEADSIVGNPDRIKEWLDNTGVATDAEGRFEIKDAGLPLEEVQLMVRDVDGKQNGSHKNKVVKVAVTPEMVDRSNAHGWDMGDLKMDLNIKLDKK